MAAFLRTLVALLLLFSALLWWIGDFNAYISIDGRTYVDSRPPPALRWAYSIARGAPAALTLALILAAAGQVSRWGFRAGFPLLAITFTALQFLFADLNMYVVGHGPGGRDWLKNGSPWGAERFLECAVGGSLLALLSLPVLRFLSAADTPASSHTSGEAGVAAEEESRESN